MRILIAIVLLLASTPVIAQDFVILADKLYTSTDTGVIDNAAIFVEAGKITGVAPQAVINFDQSLPQYHAAVVTPGLIDTRTTLGLSGQYNIAADQDHEEMTGPIQAHLRAMDSYNAREPLIDFIRRYGVTTIHATPGDNNLIAGQGAVFKTWGDSVDEAVIKPVASMVFNLGEGPKAAYSDQRKAPATRMASAAMIRQALLDARHYAENGKKDGSTDLGLAALAQVLSGDLPAVITAHREDDIATAIRIAKEFNLNLWLNYATEGYLMREVIRDSGAQVLAGPTMQRLSGLQALNASLENAELMRQAGIPITFSTGHEAYVPKSRILLFEMAIAVANGMDAEVAIRSATRNAAELLGISDRVGSVTEGKDADLVLFNGDPFEYATHVTGVFVNGHLTERIPH